MKLNLTEVCLPDRRHSTKRHGVTEAVRLPMFYLDLLLLSKVHLQSICSEDEKNTRKHILIPRYRLDFTESLF